MNRLDLANKSNNYLLPGVFLAESIRGFIANIEPFCTIFNQNIFAYNRTDFDSKNLPAICIYKSRKQTQGKYYFIYYNISIDIYLPLSNRHGQNENIIDYILSAFDILFKRNDFQKYICKYNYGIMDISGINFYTNSFNTIQLNNSRSPRIIALSITAKLDWLIYTNILINRFGVNPGNLTMNYDFDYITSIELQEVLHGHNS